MSSKPSATTRLVLLLAVAALVWFAWRTWSGARHAAAPERARHSETEWPAPSETAVAELARVADHEEVVGSVRSRRTIRIAAQIAGRVLEITPQAGERVTQGELLVRLDAREFVARLDQSRQALAAAEASIEGARQREHQAQARLDQSSAAFERTRTLLAERAATQSQLEEAQRADLEARAGVADAAAALAAATAQRESARAAQTEAEAALSHAELRSPIDGLVAERRAEPGDSAAPGVPLLVLLDPAALRVEASVREGLIGHVARGDELSIELPATGARLQGKVSEILPAADARTRSFEVRVDLPESAGVHAGMFARVRIAVGERELVRAPAKCFRRVGQLWTALVRDESAWRVRVVTLGEELAPGTVEVLSGLRGGETLGCGETVR